MDPEKQAMEIKFYGVLFAYAAGIAATSFWGTIQQEYFVFDTQSDAFMWLVLPLAGLSFFLSSQMLHLLEAALIVATELQFPDEVWRTWDVVLHDGEEHVVSFTLSYLAVQAVGHVVGDEPASVAHDRDPMDTTMLGVAALGFLAFASGIILLMIKLPPRYLAPRFMGNLMTTGYMGCAWCLLYAGHWILHPYAPFSANNGLMLAMVISVVIVLLVYLLFKIARSHYIGDGGYKIIMQLANGLCMSAPLAWGRCFMRITNTLGNQTSMPKYAQVLLNVVFIVLLIPVWRYYLLPNAHYTDRYGFLKDNELMEDTAKHRFRK